MKQTTEQEMLDTANPVKKFSKLTSEWCKCGERWEFLCYPEDGECTCGVYKHHVHCVCGKISQVG